MKIVWSAPALADRIAIFDYLEQRSPRAAVQLDERFVEAAKRLRDNPEIGRRGRIKGTRELLAHRRYLLIYEIVGSDVGIIAIVHTARQWPPARR